MKHLIKNVSVLGLIFCSLTSAATAETKQAVVKDLRICLNNVTGKISAKKACKYTESYLDAETISALATPSKTIVTSTNSNGTNGVNGATGAVGPQGATGAVGPQGATGAVGPQGITGPQGLTGSVGPQGLKGEKGDTGAQGSQGAQGHQGAQGAQGPQGSQGPVGISAYQVVSKEYEIGAVDSKESSAYCPGGMKALGGGTTVGRLPKKLVLNSSGHIITNSTHGWTVNYSNPSTDTGRYTVQVICAYVN